MDGICGLLSSISQVYWLFMLLRFLNGFAITGAMGICFPYLGEFQPTKYREVILCWMELFWTLGVIILPGIAWIIIPMRFEYVTESFKFASWNLFVAACSLPSVFIGMWLFFFPESPKFLLECGEADEALEVLRDMYASNTGEDGGKFPVTSLREKVRTMSVVSQQSTRSIRSLRLRKPKELKLLCRKSGNKRRHYANHRIFDIRYYTLMIWFPELFYRFEEFENLHPNEKASVCEVSSVVLPFNNTSGHTEYCGDPIADSVFLHTLIIGLACIPTSFWVMAAALSLTFGRGGALIGNLLFGFLIDLNCVVPIVLFASMLIGSGLLCLMLPNTGRDTLD
nr:unnamed protein product [Callosobruchus analis]